MAPDPLVRQTIVQNFEREANMLATLSHPSIPRIYDYFTEEDRSYLVLEFVHGKDLESIINDTNGFLCGRTGHELGHRTVRCAFLPACSQT